MKRSSYLIKPASSLCNMNCSYCFYKDVSHNRKISSCGIMTQEVTEKLIQKALNDANEITFAFQGGEPTLAGLNYFRFFIHTVHKHKKNQIIHYALQTNGILLDHQWLDFFKKYHFLIGISIDGYQNYHDQIRKKGNEGTHKHLMKIVKMMKTYGIEYNVLTVVTHSLSTHAKELYQFYRDYHIQYVQLIPCLPELDYSSDSYILKPKDFFLFYSELFELWYKDLLEGQYMSISLFDDLLLLFQGKIPRTCGMLGCCQIQMVIEADGSVYPCDFYALDKYKLGNVKEDSFTDMRNSEIARYFIQSEKKYSQLCDQCFFQKVCHGNCKRMNVVYFDKDYCGYREFLRNTYQLFYKMGKRLSF